MLNVFSFVCNLLIVAFMIKSLIGFYRVGGKGNMAVVGNELFKYFTVQSNVLMACASVMMIVFNIIIMADPAAEVPYWAILIKHVSTTAVMLTFCVVFFVFVPSTGVKMMIEGDNIYLHLISPLIAAVTLVAFDPGPKLTAYCILWCLIPTALYALLYYYKVIIIGEKNGGWDDFYKFNANGKWYFSGLLIFAMTAFIGFALYLLRGLLGAGH